MPTTVYVIAHLLPASHAWWLASLRARGKLACSWQVCVLVGEFACTWASLRAHGRVCVLVGEFACSWASLRALDKFACTWVSSLAGWRPL
jgi:hypothetical protein